MTPPRCPICNGSGSVPSSATFPSYTCKACGGTDLEREAAESFTAKQLVELKRAKFAELAKTVCLRCGLGVDGKPAPECTEFGTLEDCTTDEEGLHAEAWQAVFRELGIPW